MALNKLGANRITSLSDNAEEARICSLVYDTIADEVMSSGPWTKTINRVALARTANTPAFGYTYEFQLPTVPVCLRVITVNDEVPGDIDFSIEQDKLLADTDSIKIKYIGRITDTASYGPHLTAAIISRLAAELAQTLVGTSSKSQELYQEYQIKLFDGLALDGNQGTAQAYVSNDLLDVR
jgi:hypothetical protein